jgi:hypothetical protein
MVFVLMELDHGDALGEFTSKAAAIAALDRIVQCEPLAAHQLGVVAFDDAGERVGEPVTRVGRVSPSA